MKKDYKAVYGILFLNIYIYACVYEFVRMCVCVCVC